MATDANSPGVGDDDSSDLSEADFRALAEKYGFEYVAPDEGVTHVVFISKPSSAPGDTN
jgi:hypothetical protein